MRDVWFGRWDLEDGVNDVIGSKAASRQVTVGYRLPSTNGRGDALKRLCSWFELIDGVFEMGKRSERPNGTARVTSRHAKRTKEQFFHTLKRITC